MLIHHYEHDQGPGPESTSWELAFLPCFFSQSITHFLGCLYIVCARSMICTADVNQRAHKADSFKKNKHGACTAIISFCSVKNLEAVFSFPS